MGKSKPKAAAIGRKSNMSIFTDEQWEKELEEWALLKRKELDRIREMESIRLQIEAEQAYLDWLDRVIERLKKLRY